MSMIFDFVNTNLDAIIDYINQTLPEFKCYITDRVVEELKSYVRPLPNHYVWSPDKTLAFGKYIVDGTVNLNQTVHNFLETEYKVDIFAGTTGFGTYGTEFGNFVQRLGLELKTLIVKRYMENTLNIVLTEEDVEEVKECCTDYDEFFDDICFDFYGYGDTLDFIGLADCTMEIFA